MQLLDCFLYIIYPEFSLGLSLGLMRRTIFLLLYYFTYAFVSRFCGYLLLGFTERKLYC